MKSSLSLEIFHPIFDFTEDVKVTIKYDYTSSHDATFDYPHYTETEFEYVIEDFEGPKWVTTSMIDDAISKLTIYEIINP